MPLADYLKSIANEKGDVRDRIRADFDMDYLFSEGRQSKAAINKLNTITIRDNI